MKHRNVYLEFYKFNPKTCKNNLILRKTQNEKRKVKVNIVCKRDLLKPLFS